MGIKNLVFDFGQVLVSYDPDEIVSHFVTDPADRAQIVDVVFDRLYWDRLDAGTITDEELLASAKARLPRRLWKGAEESYRGWFRVLPEIPGMREILLAARSHGLGVFVLSNISRGFAEHEEANPILALADGRIYSSVCGMVKPDPAVFRHLCKTFSLNPGECLFVDDRQKNIDGARTAGLEGYLFDGNVDAFRKRLREMNILE